VARQQVIEIRQPLVAMALLGILALLLFLLGKYSAGIARLENHRLLRPGASHLLLGAYLLALVIVGIAAVQAGFLRVDLYLAYAFCSLLGLFALETLITLVLEIYRPRIKGKVGAPLYESRLVGLLSHPEGLFTAAAHALDYQFGFKVSETWFFRLLQRAFLWLVLAQLGILFLSTSFVFITAGEQALLERFGQPVRGRELLGPGPHVKFPWPIDKVYRYTNEAIQSFNIGFVHDEKDEKEKGRTVLWTVSHYKEEFHLLVASREQLETAATNAPSGKKSPPVNLLSVSIPVQYQISDLRSWAYEHKDAGNLLEKIGTREVVRYLVSIDLHEMMSNGRFKASEDLRNRIQARADELKLGAKILFVGLQDIHPPVQVAGAYEAVVGAQQKREADILAAEAHRVQTNALSNADALHKKFEAEADRARRETDARARAHLFTNQIAAFRASPAIYTLRTYLQSLARSGSGARKFILATTNTEDVILLNLEDKDLLDISNLRIPSPSTK
jgi:regulator of protease activity HflC (stomatin/prohibitin superfamily)